MVKGNDVAVMFLNYLSPTNNNILGNEKVREAIFWCVNKQDCVPAATSGYGSVAYEYMPSEYVATSPNYRDGTYQIYDYDLEEYNIWHMMIDTIHQGKGYGKAAMQKCLAYIAKKPFGNSNRVVLTCHKENETALALYQKLGFRETGNIDEDEIELALELE